MLAIDIHIISASREVLKSQCEPASLSAKSFYLSRQHSPSFITIISPNRDHHCLNLLIHHPRPPQNIHAHLQPHFINPRPAFHLISRPRLCVKELLAWFLEARVRPYSGNGAREIVEMPEVTCLFKGEFGGFVENCGQVYGLAFRSWVKICSRIRQGLGYFHNL
jgi:hypothetical protein